MTDVVARACDAVPDASADERRREDRYVLVLLSVFMLIVLVGNIWF